MEKPGIKTSEFWVAIFAPVIVGALQLIGIEMSEATIAIVIAPLLAYVFGRSWVKAKSIPTPE